MEEYLTYYHSPVGFLEIVGNEHYLSSLRFLLKDENPKPNDKLTNIPSLLIQAIEQLIQYFHGGLRQFEIPMNPFGTEFQARVWNELLNVPYGKTISYQELANRCGDPKATRAVASANSKNKLAILIPCHRVIGSNGDLVGYAGELWRKKWLLNHEHNQVFGIQTLF